MDDKIEAWRHGLLRLVLQYARAYADNSDPAKTEAAYVAICDYFRTTPEGFVLVPVEPTEAMEKAGFVHIYEPGRITDVAHIWSAMLAASQESGMFPKQNSGTSNGANDRRIAELEREIEALRKDAERYMLLRRGGYPLSFARSVLNDTPFGIDAAIDAALKEQSKC